VTLPVAPSAPGIFTATGLPGAAQAIAVNEDGSLNSISKPATAGSAITLFLTGAGQTEPVSADELIAEDQQIRLRLAVAALVGDTPAEVLSNGTSPDVVSDVMAVRVRIPAQVKSAVATSIELVVGGAKTQEGVAIRLH